MAMLGASWLAEDAPLDLYTFECIVRGSLLRWSDSMVIQGVGGEPDAGARVGVFLPGVGLSAWLVAPGTRTGWAGSANRWSSMARLPDSGLLGVRWERWSMR